MYETLWKKNGAEGILTTPPKERPLKGQGRVTSRKGAPASHSVWPAVLSKDLVTFYKNFQTGSTRW